MERPSILLPHGDSRHNAANRLLNSWMRIGYLPVVRVIMLVFELTNCVVEGTERFDQLVQFSCPMVEVNQGISFQLSQRELMCNEGMKGVFSRRNWSLCSFFRLRPFHRCGTDYGGQRGSRLIERVASHRALFVALSASQRYRSPTC